MDEEVQARSFCARFCDEAAIARLERFIPMLIAENARQNLVSSRSLETPWQRHIADSLQLFEHVPRETSPWLDLGTGAGMPGLVLSIARPDLVINLVESRKRRVAWLAEVIREFDLANCRLHGMRLESVEKFPAQVICARAFAPLEKLLSLSARFSTPTTTWLLPKGRSAGDELSRQPESVRRMFHVEQSATDSEAGLIVGHGRPDLA